MQKRAGFERSRQELSLDVSVGVHILLVVEQSSLESRSRGYAKTPILTVLFDAASLRKWQSKLVDVHSSEWQNGAEVPRSVAFK